MTIGTTKKTSSTNSIGNEIRSQVVVGRYKQLVISLGFFVLTLTGLLAYTVYSSSQAYKNTTLIAATNHVSNDVQQVIKDLFDMQVSYGEDINSPHAITVLERLNQKLDFINKNLTALETGGEVVIDENSTNKATLPNLEDAELLKSLKATREQWATLEPKVKNYLAVAKDITKDSATPLAIAVEQAKISSLSINESLQNLTTQAFQNNETQTRTVNIIRFAAIVFALVYFAIFISYFIRRLRQSDEQAFLAQKETAEIMSNVNTGLFLLDKDLKIGNQFSNELNNLMGKNTKIAGECLTKLLKNKVSDKDLDTTEGFVKQLYNPRVKEKLVNDLNPLKKVMLNVDESANNRYLDFKFSRVYQGKDIDKILVTVQDVTNQVRLEQRLEQERAQNDLQIEMLTTILNVSPSMINDFIRNTKQNIVKINDILKVSGSSQGELEDKLAGMYRIMHSLKGEASALKLHSFTNIAQNFEEKLRMLQKQTKLSGNDFLPLTIHLDELLNLSNTIESLGLRINQNISPAPVADTTPETMIIEPVVTHTNNPTSNGLNEFYEQFAQNIASRQNKQVKLTATGFDTTNLAKPLESVLKEVVIQLVRNAVVHGIESPEVRLQQGKPSVGNISLNLLDLSDSYKLVIEDDGAGIDYEAIKRKAVEMGFNADEVALWNKRKLTSLLFKSGFSTKSEVDEDAGRGVGMDVIKENVQSVNGNLGVDTKEGLSTRFTIKIPKNPII